jgi:biotin synthase
MTTSPHKQVPENPGRWRDLADSVLAGQQLTVDEGLAVLRAADDQLLDLLAAAYRVRFARFGNEVRLNFLINAKSGRCGEDCGYCSQSAISRAESPEYDILRPEELLDGAAFAAERRARTYCTVISGRRPSERELDVIEQTIPRIKAKYNLEICLSPGLLTPDQAARLKACGVDRVNHNLNTSRRFYPEICSTHTYQDRLDTLRAIRRCGMEICCGGIVGMGETDSDVVELALQLGELAVEALPVNFLQPIAGTPLGSANGLTPTYCLKVLALFRFANPTGELRIAAGREMHLGPLQPLGLYPANSIFVGDYLTTKGQPPSEDYRMIEALGFQIAHNG